MMTNDIDEMERRASPLIAAVALVLLALLLDGLVTHYQRVQSLQDTSAAFVQCMNGKLVGGGDTVIRCEVRTLVAGIE